MLSVRRFQKAIACAAGCLALLAVAACGGSGGASTGGSGATADVAEAERRLEAYRAQL